MKASTRIAASLAIAASSFMTSAQAVPTLRITDGSTTITIADGAAGDSNAAAGAVTWIGTIGVWTVNVDTGLSKPVLGSALLPHMDLAFVDVSSAASTLTILFSDTGFGPTSGARFGAAVGGTADTSVTYKTYVDAGNALFAQTTLLTDSGAMGPGAYSNTRTSAPFTGAAYSLTQVITITHDASGGSSSGDAELRIPEPGTLALLGTLLAGLGFARRRKS